MSIQVKRIYAPPESRDGRRILVDRLWPRGVSKVQARVDAWPRDIAPSDGLRRWFNHDPARWDEFRRRYAAELEERREAWGPLLEEARKGPITLLYSARDAEHNNAVALKEFLESRL